MASSAAISYLALTGGPPAYPILCSFGPPEHELTLRTLFSSKGWSSSIIEEGRTKLELKSGRHIFCIEVETAGDGAPVRVFAVVAELGYPTRFIFSGPSPPPRAMGEFRALVAAALRKGAGGGEVREQKALKSALRGSALPALAGRFSALESLDKVAAVEKKAFALREQLVENLYLATERDGLLETLEVKTRKLRDSAAVFEKQSWASRASACCLFYRWVVFATFLGLLVAAAVAAGVTKSLGLW